MQIAKPANRVRVAALSQALQAGLRSYLRGYDCLRLDLRRYDTATKSIRLETERNGGVSKFAPQLDDRLVR